ncbi:MAG: type I restriction endonuclease subunit M [Burkholderiaceae bacterium]|nr:type I restriction endonuclease subunit M [Burkholderiaceae bacterium]
MTDTGQAAACTSDISPHAVLAGTPLFDLGQVLATPGALGMLEALQLTPLPFVVRHVSGDWGDICSEDRQANAEALEHSFRLMSVYVLPAKQRLWVITEADRSYTTLLLPEEY